MAFLAMIRDQVGQDDWTVTSFKGIQIRGYIKGNSFYLIERV